MMEATGLCLHCVHTQCYDSRWCLENHSAQFLSQEADSGRCSCPSAPKGTGCGKPPEAPRTHSYNHLHSPPHCQRPRPTPPVLPSGPTPLLREAVAPALSQVSSPTPHRDLPLPSNSSHSFQILKAAEAHLFSHSFI